MRFFDEYNMNSAHVHRLKVTLCCNLDHSTIVDNRIQEENAVDNVPTSSHAISKALRPFDGHHIREWSRKFSDVSLARKDVFDHTNKGGLKGECNQ